MHPMGDSTFIKLDSVADNTHGLIYVHVPKNASCWVKHHLNQVQSGPYNYYHQGLDVEKHLALVVLRDPVERWISAMGQILVGNKSDYYMHVDNLDWDKTTQEIMRNNHTQPQHEFFANIPHDRIVWFRCDDQLPDNFSSFLKQYNLTINLLSIDQDTSNIFNVTKKVPERTIDFVKDTDPITGDVSYGNFVAPPQQVIVDKIKLVLDQHPEYVQKIKNLYQEDLELFHSVPYYEPR
jgi:hypothetical protein